MFSVCKKNVFLEFFKIKAKYRNLLFRLKFLRHNIWDSMTIKAEPN